MSIEYGGTDYICTAIIFVGTVKKTITMRILI